MTPIIKSAW